ncbi:hypothetical protein VTO73DRAFT_9739 [Trametes versicolor]
MTPSYPRYRRVAHVIATRRMFDAPGHKSYVCCVYAHLLDRTLATYTFFAHPGLPTVPAEKTRAKSLPYSVYPLP